MIGNTAKACVVTLGLTALAACDSNGTMHRGGGMMGGSMMDGGGMMGGAMARHRYAMHQGLPAAYDGLDNPLRADTSNLTRGGELYRQHCASCHGPNGLGDGPAGKNLQPPPANIASFARMPMASDGYLYWTIAEGGAPIGSAMPAFEPVLSAQEIWQTALYVRQL